MHILYVLSHRSSHKLGESTLGRISRTCVASVSVGRKNVGNTGAVVSVGSQKVAGPTDCVVGSQKDAAKGDADVVDRSDAVLEGSSSVAFGVGSTNVFVRFQAVMFITSNVGLMMFCVVIPGITTAPVMLLVTVTTVTLAFEGSSKEGLMMF
jgi:hypothetical protein